MNDYELFLSQRVDLYVVYIYMIIVVILIDCPS